MSDSNSRLRNWFQIISNVAIIVGLGLVVYELNQSKQLAFVQFMNDDFARLTDVRLAMMGDDPREALARAVSLPRSKPNLACRDREDNDYKRMLIIYVSNGGRPFGRGAELAILKW